MKERIMGLLIVLIAVFVGVQLCHAESDFMWFSPASIMGAPNSIVQVQVKLTSYREVGAVTIGLTHDSDIDVDSATRGAAIPAGWDMHIYAVGDFLLLSFVGSGFDYIQGEDLVVANINFEVEGCGTSSVIDWYEGSCSANGGRLSTIQLQSIMPVDFAYSCGGPKTLYLTNGSVGATACECPPCGCSCELEASKRYDTWSAVKRRFYR